ncbi:MAG: hypothetical protein NTX25_19170 [Proteobacteria bacterium]|nr:hypothetical protein [Pseudomonadota bacterium]
MNFLSRSLHGMAFFAVLMPLLQSCSLYLDDAPDKRDQTSYEYAKWVTHPDSSNYEFVKCSSSQAETLLCGQRPGSSWGKANEPQYSWQSNCQGTRCQTLSLFVHYTLQQNLGSNQNLLVEAFQNPQFTGSPAASIQIAGFDASRPNSTGLEEIYLAPGEYYLRAYFTTAQAGSKPYPLGDMIPVGMEPSGIYGAVSAAKRIVIKDEPYPETLHISIDQLYKKPGSEPESHAQIRLHLSVNPDSAIPLDRKVLIFLLTAADLEATPVYTYSFSSNMFLLKNQENQAEFVSPSLSPGNYYLFVFIDKNSNGYYDKDEIGGFYKEAEKIVAVPVEHERMRNLDLLLQSPIAP